MDSILSTLIEAEASRAVYTSYFRPTGNFSPKGEGNFLRKYGEVINDDSTTTSVCMGEKITDTMPIIAMGQLKFRGQPPEHLAGLGMENFLMGVAWAYQEMIKQLIEFPHSDSSSNLTCMILCRDFEDDPQYYEIVPEGYIVNFRIQFPYCRVDMTTQDIVRQEAIKHLQEFNIRGKLQKEPIGTWDEILVDVSRVKSIPLYGSISREGEKSIHHQNLVPKLEQVEIEDHSYPENEELDTFFKLENYGPITEGKLSFEEILPDGNFYPEDWLHILLSIRFWKPVYPLRGDYQDLRSSGSKDVKISFDDPKRVRQLLLNWISRQRAQDRGDWERIGQALYHETGGSDEGLDEWISFTESCQHSPFDEEECCDTYHTFTGIYRTVLTLEYYASRDSKEEYENWHSLRCLDKLETSSKCPDIGPVAEAFYACYKGVFLFDGTPKGWWWFDKHVWRGNGFNEFKNVLSDNRTGFKAKYIQLRDSLNRQIGSLRTDDPQIQGLEAQMSNIGKIMKMLNDPSKKNSIITECERLFEVDRFEVKRDMHFELMGCKDCVIDTSGNKAVLRDGMPEDFVTRSAGHSLRSRPYLSWDSRQVKQVKLAQKMMFPDKDVRRAVNMLEASLLIGGNQDKKIPMGVGARGDEGKSAWKQWIETALGPYAGTTKASALLVGRTKDAGNADPEKMQYKYCNVVFFCETKNSGAGSVFDREKVKGSSGNDKEYARDLFQKGSENTVFRQRQTLLGLMNQPPRLDEDADAPTKRRFSFIFPFESRFVPKHEAPETLEEQFRQRIFPLDPHFEKKIGKLGRAKLWTMVQNYEEYFSKGLQAPMKIQKMAEEYWRQSDIYGKFMDQNLTRTNKNDDVIPFSLVYGSFQTWHKTYYPQQKIPNGDAFQFNMESSDRMGNLDKMTWIGWKFGEVSSSEGSGSTELTII